MENKYRIGNGDDFRHKYFTEDELYNKYSGNYRTGYEYWTIPGPDGHSYLKHWPICDDATAHCMDCELSWCGKCKEGEGGLADICPGKDLEELNGFDYYKLIK